MQGRKNQGVEIVPLIRRKMGLREKILVRRITPAAGQIPGDPGARDRPIRVATRIL